MFFLTMAERPYHAGISEPLQILLPLFTLAPLRALKTHPFLEISLASLFNCTYHMNNLINA